ncbi:MAG: hypothetical protein LBK00_01825 [Treponema sp.]|nr:hypothetical protein [Treponema sp.]
MSSRQWLTRYKNIPYTAATLPLIEASATQPVWQALSPGACLGDNGTLHRRIGHSYW